MLFQVGGISSVTAAPLNTNISQFESYIYNTFLFPVNKGEALEYLDQGGAVPKRYAKVIAVRGGKTLRTSWSTRQVVSPDEHFPE